MLWLGILVLAGLLINSVKRKESTTVSTRAELGERLFFDPILSLDSSISCASCHKPEFAFSDTVPFSTGVGGSKGLRNTPSVMNVLSRGRFFYDGRARDIQDQVHFPVEDQREMNLNFVLAVERVNRKYKTDFMRLYGEAATARNLADAIAEFEKTLESSNTPFDAYMSDQEEAISESAKRGRELFLSDKAKCFDCHFGPDFTGDEFRNIGLFDGYTNNDAGRFKVTGDSVDLGKFKVPGLRNVGVTGPYMHDGRFKTLSEVIDYYNNPYQFVKQPVNIDPLLVKPLQLTEQEKQDLIAFLLTLTDKKFSNR